MSVHGRPGAVRVLIAEDARVVRRAIASLLVSEPAISLVGTAVDAAEAIALAQSRKPDVVLIDVKMPAGGGARATREIRRTCPGVRVVALSAHEDEDSVLEMIDAGADAYLLKGAPGERLVAAILEAAGGALVDLSDEGPALELPG